ncbi:DNA-directed RNA polymerase subunit H [Natronorarus salvus]|uniref:DNA-directed RNA polymerase subunit H n=1 Tax=Natronorarus salvus TaxID=3117733 RepID=UPI002F268F3F
MDVSQHTLVPEHTVMDEESIQTVLDEYGIKPTDLPKIKRTDSALPDDAEVGDVIRIERESRTTDRAVVYRLVIE